MLISQTTEPENDAETTITPVFAPFPDKIRVGSRATDIIISWEDSPDVQFGYSIFRSEELPAIENYKMAEKLADVASDVGTYTLKSTNNVAYYYFILAKTADDSVYEIFIPLRNVTLMPVEVAAAETTPSISELAVNTVMELKAELAVDAVKISFKNTRSVRTVLYRATVPVRNSVDLLNSIVVTVLDSGISAYQDYPIPGVPYYYAAIPETSLKTGTISFTPGLNSTIAAVTIPAGLFRSGLPAANPVSRSIPLPYLVIDRGVSQNSNLAQPNRFISVPISADTEKAVNDILRQAGKESSIEQPSLSNPGSLSTVSRGEAYLLQEILVSNFTKDQYADTVKNLNLFLSLPRSPEVAARARLFKGQSYVKLGLWREAFFEFLQAQPYYYRECTVWIDYLLDMLNDL